MTYVGRNTSIMVITEKLRRNCWGVSALSLGMLRQDCSLEVRTRDGVQTGVPRASGPENEVAGEEGPQGPPATTGASYRDVVS